MGSKPCKPCNCCREERKPVKNSKVRRMAMAGGVGDALPLLDGVRGPEGKDCYFSWPGIHQREWNNIVSWVELFGHLEPGLAVFSTACVFLPIGDPSFGQHSQDPCDNDGGCWCRKLYGEPKEWGCRWFELWQDRLRDAISRRQMLIAVYKRGEKGQGDDTPWSAFPAGFSTAAKGLGGSQRGEVAFATELLGGAKFRKVDVDEAAARMDTWILGQLERKLRGRGGISRFSAAVRACRAARIGLDTLNLHDVSIAGEELYTFIEALRSLQALRDLRLRENDLGAEGALVLARALPAGLETLALRSNSIGDAGARAIAKALPASLETLALRDNNIGDAGARAIAKALPGLAEALPGGLKALYLSSNIIGDEGALAIAEALQLVDLERLELSGNRIGDKGALAIAEALPVSGLRQLDLSDNSIGDRGAWAIVEALPADLEKLWLSGNDVRDKRRLAIAEFERADPHPQARR